MARAKSEDGQQKNGECVPVTFVSRDKDLLVLNLLRSGRYSVTNDGEIITHCRGTRQIEPRPVAQWLNSRGYFTASLNTGARKPSQILAYVHRVVALAVLGDPGMPLQVIHRNGNKQDNRPPNLRWADSFDAMRSASKLGLLNFVRGAARWNAKLTDDEVRQIRRRRRRGQTVPIIIQEMKLAHRVTPWAVYVIARGDTWQHVT